MAVKIRLKRIGRKNRPFYRICVFDSRTRRDGKPIEELGHYSPWEEHIQHKVELDRERALHWLNVGAQPSETVGDILRRLKVRKGEELTELPEAPERPAGRAAAPAEPASTATAPAAATGTAAATATAEAPATGVEVEATVAAAETPAEGEAADTDAGDTGGEQPDKTEGGDTAS